MATFLRAQPSRLLVSELAWSPNESPIFESFLRSRGIHQQEIVPSKRNWNMTAYTNAYSAQSILYGVDIQIFQEPKRFLDILRDRLDHLRPVGVTRVIFGSPKQRIYSGEDAVSLFRDAGDVCKEYGIILCLENNARCYGTNWLYTIKDTVEFVECVNHPYIGVNLDIGSMILEKETMVPATTRIEHIQVSFPNLSAWNDSFIDEIRTILSQLSTYSGKISLEMTTPSLSSIQSFLTELSPSQTPP